MSGKPTDGFISRYINRRFSKPISTLLVKKHFKIKPVNITLTIFLASITPLPLLLMNHRIIGGIMIEAASILDGVDGEYARLTKQETVKGAIIDSVLDRIVNITIYLGTLVYLLNHSFTSTLIISSTAMLALSGDMLVSYVHSKFKEETGVHPLLMLGFPNIASRDLRLLVMSIATIADTIVIGYTVIIAVTYIYVTARFIETLRTINK